MKQSIDCRRIFNNEAMVVYIGTDLQYSVTISELKKSILGLVIHNFQTISLHRYEHTDQNHLGKGYFKDSGHYW